MKPGDLRKFKIESSLKSVNLDGKPFLVVKHGARPDDTHLVSFLLDGKVWELASSWVLLNSEAIDEAG